MTSTCDTAFGCLLDIQQSDGGWAYSTNSSWTEPTCYAILALRSAGGPEPAIPRAAFITSKVQAIGRACEWLARRQRRDGGWSPGPAVEQSTHVTSLAILALTDAIGYEDIADRGVDWLLAQSGAESSFWARLARYASGTTSHVTEHVGWPWFPGAAAWVIPTSLAICALARNNRGQHRRDIPARIDEARQFLLSRRCPDHGWNHGGLFRPGETPVSYPETTGIALLALAGARSPDLDLSLRCAEQHAYDPKSSEGANWLRLGLLAAGRNPPPPSGNYRDWTVNQIALRIITQAAEAGQNPFISHV